MPSLIFDFDFIVLILLTEFEFVLEVFSLFAKLFCSSFGSFSFSSFTSENVIFFLIKLPKENNGC